MSHHEHEHDTAAGGEQHHHGHHHEPEISDDAQLVACPVMPTNLVNVERAEAQGLFRDYKGQRYWFCCAACGPLWDAQPDKYAAA
ncbi:YHS domain-containing protein [Amnibacterium flavum]|uniref:YHS domain-containing protein n=1 Tax=Amnibacterium flavum TaxID=2173173 RepID=A0A2V1HNL2_9MICO|nr:YHS domain-containing protein [Amnibacterium flavum]PVZ93162.1 hypothetical protein DDQ50_16700 [Amnibacterium flavum]